MSASRGRGLSKEAMADQGFKPLMKRNSEGVPRTRPLPMRQLKRTRSRSDSFYVTKTYCLGSFAEVKYEELPRLSPFKASFSFAAPPAVEVEADEAGSPRLKKPEKAGGARRKRVYMTVQARKARCTVSLDGGVALALACVVLAVLVGQVAAYVPSAAPRRVHAMPKSPLANRAPQTTGVVETTPHPFVSAPFVPDEPLDEKYEPATAAAAKKLQRATRYLSRGKGSEGKAAKKSVDEAVSFAVEAHMGQTRKSGEAYVVHPIETACILAEMKADVDTIVAGLLHDVVEDTDWSAEQLCARFGESVAGIVDGVTDVEDTGLSKADQDAYNQQRLLLAMGGSLNVVLVKLADRVHNMRTLGAMPAHKREKKAKETMELFVPLAKTVGVAPMEEELRALSAQHLSPFAELSAAAERNAKKQKGKGKGLSSVMTMRALSFMDQSFATATCPALLAEFMLADSKLKEANLGGKLAAHRDAWSAHCDAANAPHLSSSESVSAPSTSSSSASSSSSSASSSPSPSARRRARPAGGRWFGGGGGQAQGQREASSHLTAAYATALVAGFANAPAAFGADGLQAIDALATLFQ